MILDGPLYFLVPDVSRNLEVLLALFLIKLLEHGLDYRASGQLQVLVDGDAEFLALPLNLSLVLVAEVSQQLPDKVDLLFALFGHWLAQRPDDLLALLCLSIHLGKDAP